MRFLLSSFALFTAIGVGNAAGTVLTEELLAALDQVRVAQNVQGVTMSVVQNGTVETAALGIRSETEAMTDDTVFFIASCSKSFTAAAMGILIDDFARGANNVSLPSGVNTLDWNTKMKDLLPDEWKLMDNVASEYANVHDILSHVSGMPRHDLAVGANDTLSNIVKNLRNLRPVYELREKWSYNNLMYMVVAHVVSKYSGMPFVEFVQKRIFEPLNMTSSSFTPTQPNMTASWSKAGRLLPKTVEPHQVDVVAGAGGALSNVIDLSRYLVVLLNGGLDPVTNATLIPPHVINALIKPYAIADIINVPGSVPSPISAYGMGWQIDIRDDARIIIHHGGIPGFTSVLLWIPKKAAGISILTNGDSAIEFLFSATDQILAALLDGPAPLLERRDFFPSIGERMPLSHTLPKRVASVASTYAGRYTAQGYAQDVVLCAAASNSPECKPALDAFSSVGPLDEASLYAPWSDNLYVNHLRFTPSGTDSNTTFAVQSTSLYPQGHGKNQTAFESPSSRFVAQFDVVDGQVRGFGMSHPNIQKTLGRTGTIEGDADIWFKKLE